MAKLAPQPGAGRASISTRSSGGRSSTRSATRTARTTTSCPGRGSTAMPWTCPPANTPRQNASISPTPVPHPHAWAAGKFDDDWGARHAEPRGQHREVPLGGSAGDARPGRARVLPGRRLPPGLRGHLADPAPDDVPCPVPHPAPPAGRAGARLRTRRSPRRSPCRRPGRCMPKDRAT